MRKGERQRSGRRLPQPDGLLTGRQRLPLQAGHELRVQRFLGTERLLWGSGQLRCVSIGSTRSPAMQRDWNVS